jgi:glycosyltransferase involved in cell wall biosynthesis
VLALNPSNDPYTPELQLPVRIAPISIKREISVLADFLALWQLYILFRHEKPDLVWSVTPKGGLLGMFAAFLARVKNRVFIFQGEVWASKKGLLRWILKSADRVTAFFATDLFAVSLLERDFLEQEGVVSAKCVKVLGRGSISGVDINRYRPDSKTRTAIRSKLGIPPDGVVALFVGRLTNDKGIRELANAFRELSLLKSNVWLIIVGPDEQGLTPYLKSTLGDAVTKCHFVGFSRTPESYMAIADFLCLPSYREGFSMAVIEAAAVGIPTIGSNIPGIADTIENGKTGLLVEVRDVNSLQNAMLHLASDPSLCQQLGLAARQNVQKNFESSEVVNRYVEQFRSLLYPA